jgi:hypothetical protein
LRNLHSNLHFFDSPIHWFAYLLPLAHELLLLLQGVNRRRESVEMANMIRGLFSIVAARVQGRKRRFRKREDWQRKRGTASKKGQKISGTG